MKRASILAITAAITLASCVSIDASISKVNASVREYCNFLTLASTSAHTVSDRAIIAKIDAAVSEYCKPGTEIKDIPTALVALSKIYQVVSDAEKAGRLSLASN
jgi:hypothetical protein